ncbi:MAG: SUMF1/EgtB/PvdO family nonheme iron enzyme [Caldilineaceae bacterium]|nr:SUMF1/EgtB/PvdO family nonheme iron enzyme [Caldilineaceae bacterium]
MNKSSHQAWGEKLFAFRQRAGYRQGELADALSFVRLPLEFSESNSLVGDNITFQNYEISRFEQGHRCPRPRLRHLALIYGLVQLQCIESAAEADAWLALADQRPLNSTERALIFGQRKADLPNLATAAPRLELEVDARQLQQFDVVHRNNYLNRLLHHCEYLPLQGMAFDTRSAAVASSERIGLLDVYIELDTTAKTDVVSSSPQAASRSRLQPLSVLQALIRSPRMVLLGAPGSGKSTLVHYLAYCLANHHLSPAAGWLERHLPNWPTQWQSLLPIAISLRELGAWIQSEGITQRNSRLLLDYLQHWLHQRVLDEFYFVLKEHLRRGEALLLLDGFDELPDEIRLQRQLKEMIGDLPAAFPTTPMLVTCRVLSYRTSHWQLDEQEWPIFELADLTDSQIRHFIADWYQLMTSLQVIAGSPHPSDVLSDRLQRAVFRPDLLRLARNPLLLTVMALVHTHKGQLPDARALLFEAVVDLMLWRWEAIKLKDHDGSETTWRQLLASVQLSERPMKERLWKLAFHIHGRAQIAGTATGGIEVQEATADISESELLATLRELHPTRNVEWAEQIIQIIQLRAGLLVEKSPKLFGFPHRTFQEYLAACHLATQQDFVQQALALIDLRQGWHEVILLAIGYLVHCRDAIEQPLLLLRELCPEPLPAQLLSTPPTTDGSGEGKRWQKVWLAGKALIEIGVARAESYQQGRVLIERMRHRLTYLISHDLLEPRLRAEAGTALSVLGDPRALDTFASVPAGLFRMGNNSTQMALFLELGLLPLIKRNIAEKDVRTYLEASAPQHEVHLETFHVSCYPITNSQYASFISATGHPPPDHWRGSTPPPELRNHPVVFVSWYDTQTYCRWRSEIEDALIRLPTEAEWEKAAIGEQGSLFPWGDDLYTTNLNNYQAGVGTTSTVGIFSTGASPYGCFDMAGNVYEWTSSLWGIDAWQPTYRYPYRPNDGREDPTAPATVYRVLRGGAYYLSNIFTSCTYRDRDLPQSKGRSLGFRVVKVAS